MVEKTVKNKGQQCLNIAVEKLLEEGWKICGDVYVEFDKFNNKTYCIKMEKED